MSRPAKLSLLVVALAVSVAGCEDSAKRPVQVRPTVTVPQRPPVQEPLPLMPEHVPAVFWAMESRPAVDVLLEKVQASYQAGEQDYQAGHLDAARKGFDRAVELIVSSGLALESDPRLEQLFDQIVEKAHAYALDATNETESTEEPEGEPAPIDEIAEMTVPAGDPGLAAKAELELLKVRHDLPLTINEYVLSYLSFFQTLRGRAIVETGLRRAGRYSGMIRRVLKEEGLPQDLLYVAQAESAFKPQAVSRAGARGIWQFMPFRGQEYDLERTWWVDDRSDPEKATRAAARHLRDLYQIFGDWYLVLAAYNSGPMNVVRAIERTGYADFWELQKRNVLPRQTNNYVPIILALALVAKEPARYGVQVDPEAPPRFDVVKPGHPIDLRLVADTIDADIDTLKLLNPELLRLVTPNDSSFELRLPEGTAEKFRAEITDIPAEKWMSWRRHRVQEGDTLLSIARQYRLTAGSIAQVNGLDTREPLSAGTKLIIPAAAPVTGKLVRYRVIRGDTLEGIAGRFDITVAELKRWNGIRGNRAPRGARLKIYPGGLPPPPAKRSASKAAKGSGERKVEPVTPAPTASGDGVQHRVKPGETLYSIARAHQTTVAALRQTNPFLVSRPLEAGDLLTILPRQ